jgi:tetratricopeptide (TPR) repeat protein
MEGRKLAVVFCVAASCAGCVTQSKNITVPPETLASLKGVKEQEYAKRDAKPQTWVAQGQLYESQMRKAPQGSAEQSLQRDEARKAYQKAIDIDPKCVEAHSALANLYLSQDDYDRAIGAYQYGLKLNPNSAPLWFEAGLCHTRKKDFPQALACLSKAHERDPQNHDIATTYGLLLARAGRPQDAVPVLARVMNRADANYYVARMMNHLNQSDQSRQYLQAALAERPTHQPSLVMLAQLDGRAGQQPPATANGPSDPAVRQASFEGQ